MLNYQRVILHVYIWGFRTSQLMGIEMDLSLKNRALTVISPGNLGELVKPPCHGQKNGWWLNSENTSETWTLDNFAT